MNKAWVIGIVGAESTGKSTLALALRDALGTDGVAVAHVGEALREFCDAHARTPRRHEQAAIADEQTRRIEAAAQSHRIVVADTTALMTAVYSEIVFADRSLYAEALRAHGICRVTLLTALDLPWLADGLQRDGEHVREPVDTLLRSALRGHEPGFALVSGHGAARTEAALAAVRRAQAAVSAQRGSAGATPWRHVCERCGDPNCERHLLPRAQALQP
jgi:nicotinamide riboside kinase